MVDNAWSNDRQHLEWMNFDFLLKILNHKLLETQNRPLNYTEILLLRGIWHYQTYNQIAQEEGYSPGYLTNVVAPELCRRLSVFIGRRVTKKNCRALLESYATYSTAPEKILHRESLAGFSPTANQETSPRFPSGLVPLDSPYYIEQSEIEAQVYEEIRQPGALVRIHAAQEMGKTSLLLRILNNAHHQGYYTVNLDLTQIDQTILSNVNRFLRWLCANITRQLQLEPKLDEYWDEDIGSKVSCTHYLQIYILESIDYPLIIAFDAVDQIFAHPQVAKDFFLLLRSWYEETKRSPIWQKLHLIVAYCTESDVPIELHQSPFNIGLPIHLNGFSLEQIKQLALRYGLDWNHGEEAHLLMQMVGGHPALVQIAFYHLSRGKMTLAELLGTAPFSNGIYSHHLQRHWAKLQAQEELAIATQTVMNSSQPVLLEPDVADKLNSMGLIKYFDSNHVIPSCELYRLYFQSNFIYLESKYIDRK
jgi:hypothetical protein